MTRLESDAVFQMTLAKFSNKLQQMVIRSKWDTCRTIWKTMEQFEMSDLNLQPNEIEL